MASLYAEIEINAPKNVVWKALTAKDRWLHWNTFLFDSDPYQSFRQGKKVKISLRRLPEDEETEIQPQVTLIQPGVCLKWVSSIPGFRNEYVFELQEIGVKRTKYIHKDNFSGIFKSAFLPFIREDEQRGIRRMARELKRYVEKSY